LLRTRVIPCLLLKKGGLVKTVGFASPKYVGDPINAVRIFNEKEVDELLLFDIEASKTGREPDYSHIQDIVSEAFMPIGYAGGVQTVEQAQRLVGLGVEKVAVNSAALRGLTLISEMAVLLGSQSVAVAVDVKKDWLGRYRLFDSSVGKPVEGDVVGHVQKAVEAGAGEIFVNSVERDGTNKGYDLELIRKVANGVHVPVIACGGAGKLEHFREAVDEGAAAVAAGSMFVYVGKHRAVMINYPAYNVLQELFQND
jgi:imidazole glycerol-phosphate synthase subunit HisF